MSNKSKFDVSTVNEFSWVLVLAMGFLGTLAIQFMMIG
jgi:hypothetical protein